MSEIGDARGQLEQAKQHLEVSREAAVIIGAPHARKVVALQTEQVGMMEAAGAVAAEVREIAKVMSRNLGLLGLLITATGQTQGELSHESEQVGISFGAAHASAGEALNLTTTTLGEDEVNPWIEGLQRRNETIARSGNRIAERAQKAANAAPSWTEMLQGAMRRLQEVQDGVDIIVRQMGEQAVKGAFSPTNDQLMGDMKEIGEDGDAAAYNTTIEMIDERIQRL